MLLKRILTGMITIPIITAIIFYSPLLLSVFALLIIAFAIKEYYDMEKLQSKIDYIIIAGFALILCFLASKGYLISFNITFILLLVVLRAARIVYYNKINNKEFLLTCMGNIYITYFFLHLIFLRNIPEYGAKYVFFVFLLVWITDTSAYFIGMNFGKNKLAPSISPNKTREGALAGMAGAVLMTLLVNFTFIPAFSLSQCFIIGIIFSIIAQAGDLFESSLKRKAGIKDSGNLIPGHGGVLDRFDSLFFTIPVFYYYVKFLVGK